MLKKFCKWILSSELDDQYLKGVEDGVNQMYQDPKSAMWMVVKENYS